MILLTWYKETHTLTQTCYNVGKMIPLSNTPNNIMASYWQHILTRFNTVIKIWYQITMSPIYHQCNINKEMVERFDTMIDQDTRNTVITPSHHLIWYHHSYMTLRNTTSGNCDLDIRYQDRDGILQYIRDCPSQYLTLRQHWTNKEVLQPDKFVAKSHKIRCADSTIFQSLIA